MIPKVIWGAAACGLLAALSFSSGAQAAMPVPGRKATTDLVAPAWGGCGAYGHRGPWGGCRPGGQWGGGYYRPYRPYQPYYYGPRSYHGPGHWGPRPYYW